MKKPCCTCQLAYGPAEEVSAELHDEDCHLYLQALAAEEIRERAKTLHRATVEDG